MRILITGSRGFIGSYLVKYFSENFHQVTEVNRDTLDLTDGPAVDGFLRNRHFDLVVHCALYGRDSINDPDDPLMVGTNMAMWDNLVRNKDRFRRLVNFGSGYEFDLDTNIDYAREEDIFGVTPKQTYGLVKNMISRDIQNHKEFYNLRVFGIFHYSESKNRYFQNIHQYPGRDVHIKKDRFIDFFNLEDIPAMLEIIMEGKCNHNDINLVYQEKQMLSDITKLFAGITMNPAKIIIDSVSENNYTGDHTRFYSYNTPKLGLHLGFIRY